jgi:anti-anti-sigma factor
MPARVEVSGRVARIVLSGELDYSTQGDIRAAMDSALQAKGAQRIEVDLAATSFIDSSVIRAFLNLQREAGRAGKSMTLINLNDAIQEIFTIGGFDKVFKLR